MANLGERLKEARLKQGLSIKEIAGQTRIQTHFLEAIEQNEFEKIPGAFFRKSFLRQYAIALGLNPDEFEVDSSIQFGSYGGSDDLQSIGIRAHEQPDLPPLPTSGRNREFPFRQVLLSLGLLVGVVAVCAVAYMFWEDFQVRERTAVTEPAQPSAVQAPTVTPLPASTPENSDGVGTPTADDTAPPEDSTPSAEQTGGSGSAVDAPAPLSASGAAAPDSGATETPEATPPAPSSTTHGSGSRELKLTANALTWVRVREGDRTLYVGTIDVGQTRLIRVSETAQILVGNAGGLNVEWQGSDIGKVGPSGQIRTVTLTPEKTTIQAPAPKAPGNGGDGSETTRQGN